MTVTAPVSAHAEPEVAAWLRVAFDSTGTCILQSPRGRTNCAYTMGSAEGRLSTVPAFFLVGGAYEPWDI